MYEASTIVALASPAGGARRGVVRASGPLAAELVRATTGLDPDASGPAGLRRGAHHARFRDGRGEQPVVLFWMPGPRSYTREDVAEFHLWGARPLLDAALARLCELGARPAVEGEFTRRAFLNGRIDLTRAEGVLALIEARDEDERRAATLLLSGGLARRVEALRDELVDVRALCEASLDFEESDTAHIGAGEIRERADEIRAALHAALSWERRRQPPSALPRVCLFGFANAGKSSLFNALAGESSIVSDLEGTTRDALVGELQAGALACLLVDGPGHEAAGVGGGLAGKAQRRFERELASADLVLWVVDARAAEPASIAGLAAALPGATPRLLVWNRIDEPGALRKPPAELLRAAGAGSAVGTSAVDGTGLPALRGRIESALARPPAAGASPARALFARHHVSLSAALEHLDEARAMLGRGEPLDLVAQALREGTDALDGIQGRTSPEDLLDRVFGRFCIGK